MAFPKIADARALGDTELGDRILELKRQLFQFRMKKAIRQEVKPHEIKHAKHELAQLLTVEHERKLAAASVAATQA
ncbi:MAG TPA: 50S ribosomal protein L29 [Coleofasciculaceae cyanobacterium]